MKHIAIIGCGVVGATIAYELSQVPGLKITVLDRQPPAQAATGAALGVLMGVISQKIKGTAWARRQTSIQRYETLIPELEAATGKPIPYNRQGILMLRFDTEEHENWEKLIDIRQAQGWRLENWDRSQVQARCPQIAHPHVVGAIYSPQDRQVDPTALTLALVQAAAQNGVTFQFNAEVKELQLGSLEHSNQAPQIQTTVGPLTADWIVIAAGLGSTKLTQTAQQPLEIKPVLGQALHLHLEHSLGDTHFQPVITGDDIHIVPIGRGEYWVGATVEFPSADAVLADADRLAEVLEGAIALCPALANATLLKTWSGLRPRPHHRPAPIIEPLTAHPHILLATGHYRNGVLLAPATAQAIREMMT
jgi:glycine oxidase ThiO